MNVTISETGLQASYKAATNLKNWLPEAKFVKESDFDVKKGLAPPKSTENDEKHVSEPKLFVEPFFFGVEKSKVANRLKRVLPKFRADRSYVRGVNGTERQ